MGNRGAAIVGLAEWKPARRWAEPMFDLDAYARLGSELLADSGLEKDAIDGFCVGRVREAPVFVGVGAVVEHLGLTARFCEQVDFGGATATAMIWRAAAAIEAGVCNAVMVLCPAIPMPARVSSGESERKVRPIYLGGDEWGSPQAMFEVPAGLVGAAPSYAMIARNYMDRFGLEEETLAKIVVDQRFNAQSNEDAIFHGKPLSLDDVMASPMVCDPLKRLEIVMPCFGGAAVLVVSEEYARRARHRGVRITGFAEEVSHRSITAMPDLLHSAMLGAASRAFAMAGTSPKAMDCAQLYDCFSITVLRTLEDAGFCALGQGGALVLERSLRFDGDFPVNTNGGQLGFGQPGLAGGLTHVIEAARQIQGRAGARQIKSCERAFVSGNGGNMAQEIALILEGA